MFTPGYRRIVTTIIKYDKVFRIVIVTGHNYSHTHRKELKTRECERKTMNYLF